jgi:hypothetical protein
MCVYGSLFLSLSQSGHSTNSPQKPIQTNKHTQYKRIEEKGKKCIIIGVVVVVVPRKI